METNTKVFALIAVQLLLVAGLFGSRGFTVLTGEDVILETAPVDPRDLFRGDYATLSYEISTLAVTDAEAWSSGDRVYVLLEQRGLYHEAASVHHDRPEATGDQVCLKGQVDWVARGDDPGRFPEQDQQNPGADQPRLSVTYGIESYFIPEGAGDPPRESKVDARIKVDMFCRGVVHQILLDCDTAAGCRAWDP